MEDDPEYESADAAGAAYFEDFRDEYGGLPINNEVCEGGDRRMLEEV